MERKNITVDKIMEICEGELISRGKESTINLDELANTLGQVEIFFGKTVLQCSRTMMPN